MVGRTGIMLLSPPLDMYCIIYVTFMLNIGTVGWVASAFSNIGVRRCFGGIAMHYGL